VKHALSLIPHYLLFVPVVGCVAVVLFLIVVTIALHKKSFVKASYFYRTFGFSLEAHGNGRSPEE
jgi:hypothetical protein